MSIATFEAVVQSGQIKLPENVHLPDKTKVYVIVPQTDFFPSARVASPHLAHPEQVIDFQKEVIEETNNAGL